MSKCTTQLFTTEGKMNTFQDYKIRILGEHLCRDWSSQWEKTVFPLLSTDDVRAGILCSVMGSSVQERNGHTGFSPVKGCLSDCTGASPLWRNAERAVCSAWRRLRLSSMDVNTWREVQRRQSQALSSVPRDKTRGNRHKMKHKRFFLNIRNVFSLWGWWGTASGCPGGWVLPPCWHARAIWTWSWAGRLGQMTSRGLFPTSAILWFHDSPSVWFVWWRAGACLGVWAVTSAGTLLGNKMCSVCLLILGPSSEVHSIL